MKILRAVRTTLFFLFLGSIVAGLLAYFIFGQDLSLHTIQAFIGDSTGGPYIFMGAYVLLSIFIPTTPMMALAGILFGFWHGLLYTTVAGILSALITFGLSRTLGKRFVDSLLEHKKSLDLIEKYDERISRHGIFTTIVLRITPVMPFNILNLLLGITKVRFSDYVLGTLIGLAPSNVAAVYFGAFAMKLIN